MLSQLAPDGIHYAVNPAISLSRLEYPWAACGASGSGNGEQPSRIQYEEWVDQLVERKFCHVVSAQVRLR